MKDITIHPVKSLTESELDELCKVLIDCVEDGASVSFMLPMTYHKAKAFWLDVAASTARGDRISA